MPWTATPVQWAIRWGKEHHKYGDDYQGVATMNRVGDKGYLSLTCGEELPVSERREFFKFFRAMGVWPVEWQHHGRAGSGKG